MAYLMRAVAKRCDVVSIYAALNTEVPENPLKYNGGTKFIEECDYLKNLVGKGSIGALWTPRFQRRERCF